MSDGTKLSGDEVCMTCNETQFYYRMVFADESRADGGGNGHHYYRLS